MEATDGSTVRQRKMVPNLKNIVPEYTAFNDNFGDTFELSNMGGGGNDLAKTSAKSENGANHNRQERDMGIGVELKETSLTRPLLEDSDTGSDNEREDDTGITITSPTPPKSPLEEEASWQIGLQVFIPYMIAGFGMVAAGLVLDIVQHWPVFVHVSEVFILVPALLGLKGNLEMTLAARLSTQANLGNMDSPKEQWSMIAGNLALTQAQAIVVGFLASVAAMIFGWIPEGKFDISHGFLLCASSVMTASLASLVLGSIMIGVIVLSRKCHINPDNVATPIAASLGDLTTLAVLSTISNVMYQTLEKEWWLCPLLLVIFMSLTPLWCVISHRNKYVHDVLYTGWTPVVGAMIISSIGGLVLDFAVANYHGIAVFQPVINGVGGNLVAVQASRLSTSLHLQSKPGVLPEDAVEGCPNPISIYFSKTMISRTSRVLLMMVIPGHLVFIYTIHFLDAGHTSITLIFALVYLLACVIQVVILLYVAVWMVHVLWKRGNDPDNFSIPYLTALGDLIGGFLLALCFHILFLIGDRDADVGD